MGHPKKPRKKYSTPGHPWQKGRIDEEKELMKEYGLRNKREIWKSGTQLSKFKRQAKKLSALDTEQSSKETKQMVDKLKSYGLIKEGSFDEILGLSINNILARRLQSMLVTKKLARTTSQARQMITHNHIKVNGKAISSPAYLVKTNEEESITFNEKSNFSNENHPERIIKKEMEELEKEIESTKSTDEKKVDDLDEEKKDEVKKE